MRVCKCVSVGVWVCTSVQAVIKTTRKRERETQRDGETEKVKDRVHENQVNLLPDDLQTH